MKVNPRTGVIEVGKPKRTKSVYTPPRKKSQAAQPDPDILAAIEQIGRSIVEALEKIQKPEVVHIPSCWTTDPDYVQPETTITVTPVENVEPIYLDETIIDVGIEDDNGFKKGEGAATFTKQEVKTDKGLAESKSKLAALKKGGTKSTVF